MPGPKNLRTVLCPYCERQIKASRDCLGFLILYPHGPRAKECEGARRLIWEKTMEVYVGTRERGNGDAA